MTSGASLPEDQRPAAPGRPDGPGRIAPGQRVTCLPGSLPARDGGRGGGVLVSIGPKTSLVDVYVGRQRRIPNELLHPDVGCFVALERSARGLRTTTANDRGWLPGWSWLGWTVAEHLEYLRGERHLPTPPPAPKRLIIVACGGRKADCFEAPAGKMYVGSYHRAARRAADAITTPGTRVMILSAAYGLLDLDEVIMRYERRLGQRYAITAQGLREQAEQLGLTDTAEVVVLAPAAYANLATHVWPHAQRLLAGTRGIGDQMARLTALATGRTTVADLPGVVSGAVSGTAAPATARASTTGAEHTVSIRGGLVHLAVHPADTPPAPAGGVVPTCPADRPGRRWKLTEAPITCTRCAAIVARRRALDRWCALIDRRARAEDAGTARQDAPGASTPGERDRAGRSGPGPRRPGHRSGRRRTRPVGLRRPGGTTRRDIRDGWRHVPASPPRDVPLTPPGDAPGSQRPSRHRDPQSPRPPIGHSPPRPRRLGQARLATARGWSDDAVPLTRSRSLTSGNSTPTNRSANGLRRASDCTTRPPATGAALANLLAPAADPTSEHASTNRPPQAAPDRCWRTARGLDRTLEVRPMTDPTTHPGGAGTPEQAPATKPVNGVPVGVRVGAPVADRRTLRHVTRAEQERLSADAHVERRARAARLDLELREQRRAAARREREADAAHKRAQAEARRARRAAWRVRLMTAMPRWADRALFVLPILFPMAVAWVGQIRFAMTVMGWPLAAAVVFAAGFELSTAYVARLDWLSRAAGDSALLFRAATWGFAAGAATMNYWHAAGPGFAPNGEAVSYGLMSITGVVLWELLSTYRHRTALRAEGKLPATRPRFGLARWIWFRPLTRVAWLLALRDGYTTTEMAWRAAIGAVELYGSAKHARTAVRTGRPVPHPEPLDDDRDDTDEATRHRGNGHDGHQPDIETRAVRVDAMRDRPAPEDAPEEQRDTETWRYDRDNLERDQSASDPAPAEHIANVGGAPTTSEPDDPANHAPSSNHVGSPPDQSATSAAVANDVDQRSGHGSVGGDHPVDDPLSPEEIGDSGRPPARLDAEEARLDSGEANVGARMLAYARARLAEGAHLTGADLDRRFGTRDYGRRILRRLATESRTVGG